MEDVNAGIPSYQEGTELFKHLKARLRGDRDEWTKYLTAVGELMLAAYRKQFATEGHGRWEPLADSTLTYKMSHGYPLDILVRKRRLIKSLFKDSPDNLFHIDSYHHKVDVGSLVSYGKWHETGTDKMPARPFLVLETEDYQRIIDFTKDWLSGKRDIESITGIYE